MKRLTTKKANDLIEQKLIQEIKHITLEGIPEVDCVKDCERIVERATQDLLQMSPDYYRIGSYMSIKRKEYWEHNISVCYYNNIKRGNEK